MGRTRPVGWLPLVWLVASCSPPEKTPDDAAVRPVTIAAEAAAGRDDPRGADREALPARPPHRIVSLVPSATELILALGAGDRLVARTAYDTDARLADLPVLDGPTGPSTEAVVSLDPDLVLVMNDRASRALGRNLTALGVRTRVVEARRVRDIARITRGLGTLLDAGRRADSLAGTLERDLARVRTRQRGSPRPTVLFLLWHDPPRTAGPETFVGEIIRAAGGRVVFPRPPAPWPEINLEAVVRRAPDYIVVPAGTLPGDPLCWLRRTPGWRDLEAVRRGRIIVVDRTLFTRPGPRVVRAARRLAQALRSPRSRRRTSAEQGCGS